VDYASPFYKELLPYSRQAFPHREDHLSNLSFILLSGPGRRGLALKGTLAEIDRLAATRTSVRTVKFVRKDFFFFAALRALADKGFKVLQLLVTWTVNGRAHIPSSLVNLRLIR
jgi:hypothetical protein